MPVLERVCAAKSPKASAKFRLTCRRCGQLFVYAWVVDGVEKRNFGSASRVGCGSFFDCCESEPLQSASCTTSGLNLRGFTFVVYCRRLFLLPVLDHVGVATYPKVWAIMSMYVCGCG